MDRLRFLRTQSRRDMNGLRGMQDQSRRDMNELRGMQDQNKRCEIDEAEVVQNQSNRGINGLRFVQCQSKRNMNVLILMQDQSKKCEMDGSKTPEWKRGEMGESKIPEWKRCEMDGLKSPERKKGRRRIVTRPKMSYVELIQEAISSSKSGKMILGEIYEYLSLRYEYFRLVDKGWKVLETSLVIEWVEFPSRNFSRIPVKSNRRRFEWKLSYEYCTPRRGRSHQSTPETLETTEPMQFYPHNSPCLKFFNYIPAEDLDRSSFTLSQSSHVSVGVETDRYHGWIPLPRDPLSDYTFLPPIVVPESSAFGSHPALFNSWAPKPWP